jgi:hypothetical protein
MHSRGEESAIAHNRNTVALRLQNAKSTCQRVQRTVSNSSGKLVYRGPT